MTRGAASTACRCCRAEATLFQLLPTSPCSQLEALTCPYLSLLSLMHGMPVHHLLLAGEVSGSSVHSSPWILSHEHRSTGPHLRPECKLSPWQGLLTAHRWLCTCSRGTACNSPPFCPCPASRSPCLMHRANPEPGQTPNPKNLKGLADRGWRGWPSCTRAARPAAQRCCGRRRLPRWAGILGSSAEIGSELMVRISGPRPA